MSYNGNRRSDNYGFRRYPTAQETANSSSWNRQIHQDPVPETTVPFNPNGTKCMIFKDRYYDYVKIIALGRMGPNTLVEKNTLHENAMEFATCNFTVGEDDEKNSVVVMQYEGKFVILSGSQKVDEALSQGKPCKAHLLSVMSAKKAFLGEVQKTKP